MARIGEKIAGNTKGISDFWLRRLEELEKITHEVLQALEKYDLKLNAGKCEWEKEEISFLGHRFKEGKKYMNKDKVEAILISFLRSVTCTILGVVLLLGARLLFIGLVKNSHPEIFLRLIIFLSSTLWVKSSTPVLVEGA